MSDAKKSLLDFAAKFLPELEKMADAGENLRGAQDSKPSKTKKKAELKKKENRRQHKMRTPQYRYLMNPPQYTVPQAVIHPRGYHHSTWIPSRIPIGVQSPYMAPQEVPIYPVHTVPPKFRNKRSKLTTTKKAVKTGNVISSVSDALHTFKKKRDKFLTYLTQLQTELAELNLPSPSSENLEVKKRAFKIKRNKKRGLKSRSNVDSINRRYVSFPPSNTSTFKRKSKKKALPSMKKESTLLKTPLAGGKIKSFPSVFDWPPDEV